MQKRHSLLWSIVAAVLIVMIAVVVLLPMGLRLYINDQLAKNPEYSGQMDSVSVHYFKPGLSLHHLHIVGRATTDQPILDIETIRLLVDVSSILQGHLHMTVTVEQPKLTYVHLAPLPAAIKKPPTYIWQVARSALLPVPIDAVMIHNGEINYIDKTTEPPFAIQFYTVNASVIGLRQTATATNPLPAHLNMHATSMGHGQVTLDVGFNPQAPLPMFHLKFALEHLQLNEIGNFLAAYTDLRAKQGEFNLYVEADAAQGKIQGYAKPFVHNVELQVPPEQQSNPFKRMYKSIVEGLTHFFKNNATEKTATKINFSGEIDDPNASMWSTIVSLLRNAFVEALLPQFDGAST